MPTFQMPKTSAFAVNFKPVDGALLYFFEAGTTTPKTTYQEEAETTPHAHPVVADANGIFAPIFLSGTYKVTLEDKTTLQIFSEDNLEANVGILKFIGSFNSSTNGGDYPTGGQQGYQYRVAEAFTLNAASGTHILYVGDYIQCNKDDASAIDADWDIFRGVQGVDLNTAQTLTNKTLTAPTITGPTITGTVAGSPTITTPTLTNPTTTTGTFATPAITTPVLNGVPTGSMVLLIGRAYSEVLTDLSTAAIIPSDGTIPQNTEGAEYITLAYTPKRADSILKITFNANYVNCSDRTYIGLWQDSIADSIRGMVINTAGPTTPLVAFLTSGSTTSRTYKIRFGPDVAVASVINFFETTYGAMLGSVLQVEEFSP